MEAQVRRLRPQRTLSVAGGECQVKATGGEFCVRSPYAAEVLWEKVARTRHRRALAHWAEGVYPMSERRASKPIQIPRASLQYQRRLDSQNALRIRLRELEVSREQFGYRRLIVLLRRGGWGVNASGSIASIPNRGTVDRADRTGRANHAARRPRGRE